VARERQGLERGRGWRKVGARRKVRAGECRFLGTGQRSQEQMVPRNAHCGSDVPRNNGLVPRNILAPGKGPIVPGKVKTVPGNIAGCRRNVISAGAFLAPELSRTRVMLAPELFSYQSIVSTRAFLTLELFSC
jgi:hypothetical protein